MAEGVWNLRGPKVGGNRGGGGKKVKDGSKGAGVFEKKKK